jgi:hypothetical protein
MLFYIPKLRRHRSVRSRTPPRWKLISITARKACMFTAHASINFPIGSTCLCFSAGLDRNVTLPRGHALNGRTNGYEGCRLGSGKREADFEIETRNI